MRNHNVNPPMLIKRDFLHLLVVNKKLYAVGGDTNETGHLTKRTIELYNKSKNCWEHVIAFKDERKGFYSLTFFKA